MSEAKLSRLRSQLVNEEQLGKLGIIYETGTGKRRQEAEKLAAKSAIKEF